MIDQKVIDHIRTSLESGITKEEVYKNFLNQGWTLESIHEYFTQIEDKKTSEDVQKRTIRTVLVFAAVLIGVGVFSLIASNWQSIAKTAKVFIILISIITSYGLGWFFKERLQEQRLGESLYLLGLLLYGAGIFLVAQIFNIRADWPDGFILWMIGSFAFAHATDSMAFMSFSIIPGIIAIIGYPSFIVDIMLGSPSSSFIFTSLFLIIVAAATCFFAGFSFFKKIPKEFEVYY